MFLFFIVFLVVMIFLMRNIRVVEQSKAFVIERMGAGNSRQAALSRKGRQMCIAKRADD